MVTWWSAKIRRAWGAAKRGSSVRQYPMPPRRSERTSAERVEQRQAAEDHLIRAGADDGAPRLGVAGEVGMGELGAPLACRSCRTCREHGRLARTTSFSGQHARPTAILTSTPDLGCFTLRPIMVPRTSSTIHAAEVHAAARQMIPRPRLRSHASPHQRRTRHVVGRTSLPGTALRKAASTNGPHATDHHPDRPVRAQLSMAIRPLGPNKRPHSHPYSPFGAVTHRRPAHSLAVHIGGPRVSSNR